jgi:hypothetical protein
MRSAVGQANSAYNQANTTAGTLGGEAQGIGANLTPFLTQEMLHPEGLGQTGITAETSAALGGAGGAMSAFNGEAAQRAGASRNAGGFQAALDDASRQRMKAAAGASEGIQAQNENLKQTQRQEGANGLQGMYGTDTSGMLNSQGQEANDINAGVNASKSGWLQNAGALLGDAAGIAGMAGGFGIPGFSGFKGK